VKVVAMFTIVKDDSGQVARVTFSLADVDAEVNVSLVGDFNDWDPLAHPLVMDDGGVQSVTLELPLGASYHFKYLADDDTWFCDPDVEEQEPNEYGELNSVVRLD
jgi:1,4-alpha-glucan branching enzyme